MKHEEQEQAGVTQQEQAGTERSEINKLEVKKETVKELSDQASRAVKGEPPPTFGETC